MSPFSSFTYRLLSWERDGVASLFDRAVIGSYHKLSAKHMQAYLDEFEFRFNNRENPYLFRDTLLRLVQSDVLTYEKLTA